MGGHKVLQLPHSVQVQDVSGVAWKSGSELIYSVSPIYGQPGIYVYDCIHQKNTRIVAPRNLNTHYPAGADYFELKGISNTDVIHFYYAPEVDDVDFAKFRSIRYLYQVKVDGSDMKRVGSKGAK